jgi:nucleotide-binding universal stress UspA family protein
MKKILVPTDFSKAAFNALEYAVNLAQKLNAEVILLNAYAVPNSSVMIDLTDVLKEDSINGLAKVKKEISSLYPEIELETIDYNGDLTSSVKFCSANNDIDLVIMGTTGATGLKETFVGSNTATLIQEINIPLIAIPFGAKLDKKLKIAVSTDLKNLKNIGVFGTVKDLAKVFNGEFHLINVSEDLSKIDPTEFIEHAADVDEMFTGFAHSFKFLENTDFEAEILDYINTNNINMLVVVSRKRNFFSRLFHKSISRKLTMHSPVPIVVLSE